MPEPAFEFEHEPCRGIVHGTGERFEGVKVRYRLAGERTWRRFTLIELPELGDLTLDDAVRQAVTLVAQGTSGDRPVSPPAAA